MGRNTLSSVARRILEIVLFLIIPTVFLSTCDQLLSVGLGDRVDIDAPSIEILSHKNGDYAIATTQIGGTFSDDYEIAALEVSFDAGETFEAVAFDGTSETWEYDFDTTAFADGEQELRIRVTDGAGKTAEERVLLYVDNHSPVVLITSPSGYDTNQFNDDITIRGEASDVSGIALVEIILYDSSGTELQLRDAEGNPLDSNVVDGTAGWSFEFFSRDYTSPAGTYSFVIVATDRAGNKSSHAYHDDDVRALNGGSALTVETLVRIESGRAAATQTITATQLESIRLASMDLSVDQNLDLPVADFSAPTEDNNTLGEGAYAIGTVRDDDGVDPTSIEIRFDSTVWEPVTATSGSGISVSWEHDLSTLSEGSHTVELRATDINGLSNASAPFSFLIDAGVPQVAVTSPTPGDYFGTSFSITGTAGDAVEVVAVDVRIGESGTYQPVTTFDSSAYTLSGSVKQYDWSHDFTVATDGSTDGSQQLRFRVTDSSGKVSTESLQVYVDSAAPEVAFLGTADGETVNGSVLVQGTTQSVSPIESIFLTLSDSGPSPTTQTYTLDSTVNEFDASPSTGSASTVLRWFKTIDTTVFSDGDLSVTMTATDAAGNTAVSALTLIVDQTTDIPTILFDNVDVSGAAVDNAFFGSASLIGRVTDDDGVGTATIEAQIDGGSWQPVTTVSGSGLSVNWDLELNTLAEGVHTVAIRGDDINGLTKTSSSVNILIDNGAPTVSISEIAVGSRTITSNFQGAYVNGTFTISGVATDSFGVASIGVEVNAGGTFDSAVIDSGTLTESTTIAWHYVVDTSGMTSDGPISLLVQSLDNTGKIAGSSVELILDTVDPVVSYILPSGGDTVNGTLLVTGTAADANKVDEVYLYVSAAGSEPITDVGGAGWTLLPQTYSWSTTIDTRLLSDLQNYTLHLVAIDAAGNRSDGLDWTAALERSFAVDQSTDKPVVVLDNVTAAAADNVFDSTDVITGTITDDDGIDTSLVEIRSKIGSAAWTTWQSYGAGASGLSVSGSGAVVDFSFNIDATLENGEPYTIEFRATDNDPDGMGAVTGDAVSGAFFHDNDHPTVTEVTINTTAQVIRSGDFTFSGSSSDTNAIDTFEITAEKDGVDQGQQYVTGGGSYSYTATVDPAGADDGLWEYTLTATDTAGRTDSISRTVLIDATAPASPIIDAFSGTYQVDELVSSGTAADGGSGLLTIQYSFDLSSWGTASGTESWFKTIDLSATGANLDEGSHTLYVRATDRAGNVSTNGTRSFVIDRANPAIAVNAAYDGTVYKDAAFLIDGTVSDSLGLSGTPVAVTATGPGGTVDLSANSLSYSAGSWSRTIPIDQGDGEYVVTIAVTDSVGRTSQTARTVNVDTSAPTLSGINLADGTLISASSYTVSGTADDGLGSGVASVEYSLDGGAGWSSATGTNSWNVALSGLTDGLAQSIQVRTTDAAGNVSAVVTRSFDVDLSAPTLTETTSEIETSSAVYRNADVSFGGVAEDGNGLKRVVVTYSKDGGSTVTLLNDTTDDGSWSVTLGTALGDGAYELSFVATDEVNKTTSFSRNVVIDTTQPTLSISSPVASELVETNSYTISGQVTDNLGKGVTALEYSLTGAFAGEEVTIPLSGLNWSVSGIDFSGGGEGAKTLSVRATDGLNPYVVQNTSFNYDTAAPTLTEAAIGTEVLQYTNADVAFSGDVNDSNALASLSITATKDSVSQGQLYSTTTSGAYTYTYTLPTDGSDDGSWVFTLTAADTAGRTTSVTRSVYIDESPPTLPLIDAFADPYYENSLFVSGTAGDAGSGLVSVEYSLDNSTWASASGLENWYKTIDISGRPEGVNTVYVRSTDRSGNTGSSASSTHTIDRSDPTITSAEPAAQNTKVDMTLDGTAGDTQSLSTVTATVSKDGGASSAATVSGSSSWSIALAAAGGDGTYDYAITATDSVGRTSTINRSVVVDTTAPTVALTSLADGDVVSAASLLISGTASDGTGVGVASAEYSLDNSTWTALSGTTNWNGTINLGVEGSKTVYVRSIDQLGTVSPSDTATISLDLTPPTLTETGVGTSSPKRSADFNVSGAASDTNGLLTWDHDSDGGASTAEVPYVEVSVDGGASERVDASGGTWSYPYTVAPDGSGDGDVNFVVTATDVVGKVSSVTRTVSVDATEPSVSIEGVVQGMNLTTSDVNGTIIFRFSADDAGVGLERTAGDYQAYWTIVSDGTPVDATATGIAGWTGITSTSSIFNISYDTTSNVDGAYDLWVGVRDAVSAAPNATAVKTDITVSQSSDRPVVTFDSLDESAAANSDNGLGQDPAILFTIEDDDQVDVSEIEYRIDIDNDGAYTSTSDFWDGSLQGADGDTLDKWEDESVWITAEQIPTGDRSLAQAKIELIGFPQGQFGIQVRARDNTDVSTWTAIYDDLSNYTWDKSGVVLFSVDYGPPSIAVTQPSSGTYNADFTLSGSASDALGVIEVTYRMEDGTDQPYSTIFAGNQPSVSFTDTVDTSGLSTGEYTLQVVATDQGGTSATTQIPITIDKDGPTISYLEPLAGETVNGTVVSVRGEAADNRQMGAVFVWHGLATDPAPTLPSLENTTIAATAIVAGTRYRINSIGTTDYTGVGAVANTVGTIFTATGTPAGTGTVFAFNPGGYTLVPGTSVWSTTIDTTAQVSTAADGYLIKTVGIDSIGNVSAAADQYVTVDQASDRPSITFSNLDEVTPSILGTGARIIGVVEDDDGVDATYIQIRLDLNGDGDYDDAGEGWADVSNPPTGDTISASWYHQDALLDDAQGRKYAQVRALDINAEQANRDVFDAAGDSSGLGGYTWEESASVEFQIDYGPPALDIVTPSSGSIYNVNSFSVTGTTNDGQGVDYVTIWVDDNVNAAEDAGEVTWIYNDGSTITSTTTEATFNTDHPDSTNSITSDTTVYNISQSITGLSDGTKPVQIKSFDLAGAGSIRDLTVVIDTEAPTVGFNTPGDSETINGSITVSGQGSDNYQLSDVYYAVALTADPAPTFPGDYTTLGQTYSWSFTLDTTGFTDGAYTIYLVAEDTAGNTNSAAPTTRAVTIDQVSDRPAVDIVSLDEAGTAVANLLTSSLTISGTVQDDDAVDAATIQIRTDLNNDGDYGDAGETWGAVNDPPESNTSLVVWGHTFTGFTDGQYRFQIRAADVNDNGYATYSSGSSTDVAFSVDLSLPTSTITSPTAAGYYNTSVTISGSATDAGGIKRVTVAYDTGGGYGAEDTIYEDTNAGDGYVSPYAWSTSYAAGNGDGQVFFRITVIDAFDKERTYEQYFTIDTAAPTLVIEQPTTASTLNGSIQSRGTTNDENQVSSVYFKANNAAGAGTWAAGDPTLNGWTLLTGTYNWEQRLDTTTLSDGAAAIYLLAIDGAGNRSDPTQAANQLSFTVAQSGNVPVVTITTSDGALLDNAGTISGTITDDDSVDVSTMEISFDNGSTWRAVSNPGTDGPSVSFSHALSSGAGLVEREAPYTVLVRVADAGQDLNADGDYVDAYEIAPVTGTSSGITISKDDTAPTLGISTFSNGVSTVGTVTGAYVSDTFTITGTSTDGVRVSTVEARLPGLAGEDTFAAVTNTGTDFDTWTWSKSGLTLSGSSQSLELRVTDVSGRQTTTAYSLLVDTAAPTLSFVSLATNPDTVSGAYNGTYTFRGSADDNVQITDVYYRFATADPGAPDASFTGWTQATGTYSWSAVLDTTTVHNLASDYGYGLWALSVDSAGNVTARQSLSFTINQASDYPTLTITTPSTAEVLGANSKSLGTVSDDDALSSLEIQIDRNNDGDFNDTDEGYVAVDSPTTVSGSSINFEHVLSALADGFYKLRMRARDANYVDGSTPFNETESGVVDFSIDTAAPALSLDQITVTNRYGGADTTIASDFNGSYVNNDMTLGFTATDASGIASVEVSTDGGTTWLTAGDLGAGSYERAITVPLDQTFDGTRNLEYSATDNNGKVTSAILTIIVDTLEPVVNYQSPVLTTNVMDDAPNVNGSVTVYGSISDSSAIASVTLAGGNTDNVALSNTGNTLSWQTSFDSSLYASATYSTDQGSNVWRFPIKTTAFDVAGNRTIQTGYLDIDPDSDRPLITVLAPSDGGSVAGTFVMNGTVTDDDSPSAVRLQVDFDNDGNYTSTIDLDGDGNTTDDFEDETTYTSLTVTDGSWSILMNSNGELSKENLIARGVAGATGTIGFRVIPEDINGTLGVAQNQTVYIDSEAPTIRGLATDGTTVVAEPTPSANSLQRETIRVRALFEDDKDLTTSSMQVSFDGGASYQEITTVSGATVSGDVGGGNPYQYRIEIPVDTSTVIAGGNGTLTIILKVTDKTFKQTSKSLDYFVDNNRPEVMWNIPNTLSYSGTIPNEVYSFNGDLDDTDRVNQLFGKAIDSGVISGVAHVDVYLVKGGSFLSFVTPSGDPGSTLAVTNSSLYKSGVDRNADGDYVDANEYAPASATTSIPYTTYDANPDYVIRINSRTESGQFDGTDLGDGDGFNESLKSKTGYDEWYAFFDTTILPDGPLSVYFVAYDDVGNMTYNVASAQIANNPPVVDNVTIGSTVLSGSDNETKKGGTQTFTINASDVEGIVVSDFDLTFLEQYANSSGTPDTANPEAFTPFSYGEQTGDEADFDSTSPLTGSNTTASASISIDTTSALFTSGKWYLVEAGVGDTDGNVGSYQFYVWVSNTDIDAPSVTLDAFGQSNVDGYAGNVESADDSPDADGQADLSGTILVTGTAYDDTQVSSVVLEISYDGGTNWVSPAPGAGAATIGTPSGDTVSGYTYPISVVWDTSSITNAAQSDLQLRVTASDGTNTGSSGTTTVDVVPYITGLRTGLDTGLLQYGQRSALGRYPVAADSTIYVDGYNLTGEGTNSVTIGGTAITPGVGSTAETLILDLNTLASETSGDVVVTTNTAESLNHRNDNTLAHNQEDNLFNENLGDDRIVALWELRSHTGITNADEAHMRVDGAGTGVDWLYAQGGNSLYFTDGALDGATYMTDGFAIVGGDFGYNTSGTPMWTYLHDSNWELVDGWEWHGSVQWGLGVGGAPKAYDWNLSTESTLGLGNLSFINHVSTGGFALPSNVSTEDALLGRYQDIRMVVSGTDAATDNHVAYRDVSSTSRGLVYYGFQVGTDAAAQVTATTSLDGWRANITKTTVRDNVIGTAGNTNQTKNGVLTPNDRRGIITTANATYFDIGVTSSGAVVAVWYDATSGELKVSYNTTPMTDAANWTERTNAIDTGAGTHVSMAIDPSDGIHLAYLDAGTAYIKYTYLPAYDTSDANIRSVYVDGLFSNGQYNGITIRDFGGGDYRPIISTFSSTYDGTKGSVRVTWPQTTADAVVDGTDISTGVYTAGNWEVMFVPASVTPSATKTYVEAVPDSAADPDTRSEFIVGYNGTNLEEARYLGEY